MNYKEWVETGNAFTLKNPLPNMNMILIPITIHCDAELCSDGKQKEIQTMALWDTGATISTIDSELAQNLCLIPTGRCEISGVAGKASDPVPTYSYLIKMGGLNIFVNNAASGVFTDQKFKMLIGMDIIRMGEMYFGIEEVDGKPQTLFSFSVPPTGEPVDYVEKLNKARKTQERILANSQVISNSKVRKKKKRR